LLVFGASGLLGANIALVAAQRNLRVIALSRRKTRQIPGIVSDKVDITRLDEVQRALAFYRPSLTVNCAAIADIDLCEADPDLAAAVNVAGARHVALACQGTNSKLIHISTDSVFSGARGNYDETDTTEPCNEYGRTKRDAELAVADSTSNYAILRTNFYGWNAQTKLSLAEWFLQGLRQGRPTPGYVDFTFSPLLASDVAELVLSIASSNLDGLYHLGARDGVTKYQFGTMLAAAFDLDPGLITPARGQALNRVVRPLNTTMDTGRVSAALGRAMPSVLEGVYRFRDSEVNGFRRRLQRSLLARSGG
jgi:dTDP-4-dehydrorhamnose reductase